MADDIYSFSNQVDLKFGPGKGFPGSDSEENNSDEDAEDGTDSSEGESDEEPKKKVWKRTSSEDVVKARSKSGGLSSLPDGISDEEDSINFVQADEFITPPPQIHVTRPRRPTNAQRLIEKLKRDQMVIDVNANADVPSVVSSVVLLEKETRRTVKVRCHGVIEKWEMGENEPFSICIRKIAEKEGLVMERISLFFKENKIQLDDTVASLHLTVTDIIECIILDEENCTNFTADDSDVITLKIQMASDKVKSTHNISRHVPVRVALAQYCESKNIDIKRIKVFFDGDRISLETAPSELDMEDEDILDVVLS